MESFFRINFNAVLLLLAAMMLMDNVLAKDTLSGRIFVAPGANLNSADDKRLVDADLEYNFALGYYLTERWATELRGFGGSYDFDQQSYDYLGLTVGLVYSPFRHRELGKSFRYLLPPFITELGQPYVRLATGNMQTDTLIDTESNRISEASLGLDIQSKNTNWHVRGELTLRQEEFDQQKFQDQLLSLSWVLPFGKIYRLEIISQDPEQRESTKNSPPEQHQNALEGANDADRMRPPVATNGIDRSTTSKPSAPTAYAPPPVVSPPTPKAEPIYRPPVPSMHAVTPELRRPVAKTTAPNPRTAGAHYTPPAPTVVVPAQQNATGKPVDIARPTVFQLDTNNPNLLARLSFKYRTSDLTDDSMSALDQIIHLLGQDPSMRIKLTGYTDNRGDLIYNLQISEKRAQAARDYLIYKGVPINKIGPTEGKGPAKPIANNNFGSGRAKNRRVEVERY